MKTLRKDSTASAVISLAVTRLFLNMTRRFAFPFVPTLSAQLGASVTGVQSAIAANAGVGVASPLFGPFSERYGRKRMLLVAMLIMTVTAFVGVLFPQFGVFYAVMIFFGFAKIIFDPAMQAYIADKVAYQQRGLAMGTTELSWAGSLLVAAPLTGFLLAEFGIQAVFLMLFLAGGTGALLIYLTVPSDAPAEKVSTTLNPVVVWQTLRGHPQAIAALSFSFLLVMANEILLISYGVWMEDSFDLVLTALGTITIVIAVAEVIGEFAVIGVSDRVGKRRLTLIGTGLSSLGYFVLPFLAFNLVAAMLGIFFIFVFVEIAIVASFPLFSEILPNARAIMLSTNVAAHSVGRFLGGIFGANIYAAGDFGINGIFSLVAGLLATLILWRFVAEHQSSMTSGST